MGARADRAVELFKSGCNCSQAVVMAFADELGVDEKTAMLISAGLGGGVGRMREVCGTVTGMAIVAGARVGNTDPKNQAAKGAAYAEVQKLAAKFKEANGSIVCKELLGLAKPENNPVPSERTKEYFKKRPCVELVRMAAEFLEGN